MTVAELRAAMENAPDEAVVIVNYEMFANRDVDSEATGMDPADGRFYIVAFD